MSTNRTTARSPRTKVADAAVKLDFPGLVEAIRQVHEQCTGQVKRAVNVGLTMWNWVIGAYIREYEQNGADRSRYGETLLVALSEKLRRQGLERMAETELRRYRLFYINYLEIGRRRLPIWKCNRVRSIRFNRFHSSRFQSPAYLFIQPSRN